LTTRLNAPAPTSWQDVQADPLAVWIEETSARYRAIHARDSGISGRSSSVASFRASVDHRTLAVGSLELIHGAPQAGAARLIGGIYQLILIAFGLIASEAAFALNSPAHPVMATTHIGQWSPVVGGGVFAIALWLALSAPMSALPELAIVIFVGWGIQQLSATETGP
jgi:hypothetical protein